MDFDWLCQINALSLHPPFSTFLYVLMPADGWCSVDPWKGRNWISNSTHNTWRQRKTEGRSTAGRGFIYEEGLQNWWGCDPSQHTNTCVNLRINCLRPPNKYRAGHPISLNNKYSNTNHIGWHSHTPSKSYKLSQCFNRGSLEHC